MANALRKAVLANFIAPEFAMIALASVRQTFDPLIAMQELIDEALKIAIELRHPIYDCVYLAAGRHLGVPLITADAAFVAKLAGTPDAQNVILLAGWKP